MILRSLEVIVSGGASCPVEVMRRAQQRFGARVLEMYGMLESGVQSRTYIEDDYKLVAGNGRTTGARSNDPRLRCAGSPGGGGDGW